MNIRDMWWAPFLQLLTWLLYASRGNWTPRFPRAWRGRRVVVVIGGRVLEDKMAAIKRDRFELKSSPYTDSLMTFYFKDEDVTWCAGWIGKRVDAFKVATALSATQDSDVEWVKVGTIYVPMFK